MYFRIYTDISVHVVYLIYYLVGMVLFLLSEISSSSKLLHSIFNYIYSKMEYLRKFDVPFKRDKTVTLYPFVNK